MQFHQGLYLQAEAWATRLSLTAEREGATWVVLQVKFSDFFFPLRWRLFPRWNRFDLSFHSFFGNQKGLPEVSRIYNGETGSISNLMKTVTEICLYDSVNSGLDALVTGRDWTIIFQRRSGLSLSCPCGVFGAWVETPSVGDRGNPEAEFPPAGLGCVQLQMGL